MPWLVLCACVGPKPALRLETCQHAYDFCTNACFTPPNYKRGGPECAKVGTFQVCPQENQILDTVEAGKCFDKCEYDDSLCRAPLAPPVLVPSEPDAGAPEA